MQYANSKVPSIKAARVKRATNIRADSLMSAAEMLREFDLSVDSVFGVTMGQFSLMELLCAVIDKIGRCSLQASVWTAAEADLRDAYTLLQNKTLSGFRLIVDRSFESRQPEYCAEARRLFGDDAIRIARTHMKCALLSNDAFKICVLTSMNLNRNLRWEQFHICNDPSLFEFIEGMFDMAFSSEATIGAPAPIVMDMTLSAVDHAKYRP